MRRAAVLAVAAVGLWALTGCDPRTLLYFLQPFEPTVPAEGPSLKGKKVVVLTHAAAGTQGDIQSLDRDMARKVTAILREKVKKIEVVDADKVWKWVEAHPNWTDPAEAAKAHEADVVLFLEIESFQVQSVSSPGLLEGNAKVHIQAFELSHPKNSKGKPNTDLPKESNNIYDNYVDCVFPKRGPIPMDSRLSVGAFKTKFLQVVATQVSWHFIEHSPEDDVEDARFNG
jgi:hypothetical protein